MKRKTKIIITFTESDLPKAVIKNASKSQVFEASLLLSKYARRVEVKKQNKFAGFIKRCFRFIKRLSKAIRNRRPTRVELPTHIKFIGG